MAGGSSVVREFDYFQIENDVNAALQAAGGGTLVPKQVSLASMPVPATAMAEKATRWAHDDLHPATFAHCLRTFYFGVAIAREAMPSAGWDSDTFYLAAILHDIKCSPQAFEEAGVSFELHGGMAARTFLLREGAARPVADAVMEAICRHKEFGSGSGFSAKGQMLRFGAQLDVLGNYAPLIHADTIAAVVRAHPRLAFNNVFADILLQEVHTKRFCTDVFLLKPGSIIDTIRQNPVMRAYDGW